MPRFLYYLSLGLAFVFALACTFATPSYPKEEIGANLTRFSTLALCSMAWGVLALACKPDDV